MLVIALLIALGLLWLSYAVANQGESGKRGCTYSSGDCEFPGTY